MFKKINLNINTFMFIICLVFIFTDIKVARAGISEINLDMGENILASDNYNYQLWDKKFINKDNLIFSILSEYQLIGNDFLKVNFNYRPINFKCNEYLIGDFPINEGIEDGVSVEGIFGFNISNSYSIGDKFSLVFDFEHNYAQVEVPIVDMSSYQEEYRSVVRGLLAGVSYRYPLNSNGGFFEVRTGLGPYFMDLELNRDISYGDWYTDYRLSYLYKGKDINYRYKSSLELPINDHYGLHLVASYSHLYFDILEDDKGRHLFSLGDEKMEAKSIDLEEFLIRGWFVIRF
ncbi:hypothetical protein [Halonatronum saccharophilum]|uniref:hypothetical protein n=1 Tax=Halonatronum saccharophilum TaxID=150060 RepID=UPI00048972AB|nr:hypothetical protein [Halonatronum saccharophilum]